jgi:hypothetical protein
MNPFSTHLVLFNSLFNQYEVSSIFEFGMGLFSTPLFLEKSESVISVEMHTIEWFNKVKESLVDSKFTCLCKLGPMAAIDYFNSLDQTFSLVFVDGHGATRWHCINSAFSKTKVIVTHDVEVPSYRWDLVNVPEDWVVFTDTKRVPHTRIYYHNSLNFNFKDL